MLLSTELKFNQKPLFESMRKIETMLPYDCMIMEYEYKTFAAYR